MLEPGVLELLRRLKAIGLHRAKLAEAINLNPRSLQFRVVFNNRVASRFIPNSGLAPLAFPAFEADDQEADLSPRNEARRGDTKWDTIHFVFGGFVLVFLVGYHCAL